MLSLLFYTVQNMNIFDKFEPTLFTQDIFPDNMSKYIKLWQSILTHNEITCQKMNEMSTLETAGGFKGELNCYWKQSVYFFKCYYIKWIKPT